MKRQKKPIHIEIQSDTCDLCGTCVGICPKNVIAIVHHSIYIDFNGCIFCAFCIDICPVRAIKGIYTAEKAAYHYDLNQ